MLEWVELFVFLVEMSFFQKKRMFPRLIKLLVKKETYKMIPVKSK